MARRNRASVAATALAFGTLAVSAPLIHAAQTPEQAALDVFDALVAKDFEGIGQLVCEERRAEVTRDLDVASSMAAAGFDATLLIPAMSIEIDDPRVSVVSQEAERAILRVVASVRLTFDVDEELARLITVTILESRGQEPTDDVIDLYLPTVTRMFAEGQTQDLDEDVEVVLEGGEWLLCDDLDDEPGGSPSPDESGAPGGVTAGPSPAT